MFNQLVGGAAVVAFKAQQVNPLFELSKTEHNKRLLYGSSLVAQCEIGGIDQLHQRKGQRDIARNDTGDLVDVRLVLCHSDHKLEEVALHMIDAVHLRLLLLRDIGALKHFTAKLFCQRKRLGCVDLESNYFFLEAVRDIDDIDQAGIGWMHLVNFAEIDLDIVERVHDSKVARRKLKPGARNAVALLAITVNHLLRDRMHNGIILDLNNEALGGEHARNIFHKQIRRKCQKRCFSPKELFITEFCQKLLNRVCNPGITLVIQRRFILLI